jgi:hypothetical protein
MPIVEVLGKADCITNTVSQLPGLKREELSGVPCSSPNFRVPLLLRTLKPTIHAQRLPKSVEDTQRMANTADRSIRQSKIHDEGQYGHVRSHSSHSA